jgi:hypothetical protein
MLRLCTHDDPARNSKDMLTTMHVEALAVAACCTHVPTCTAGVLPGPLPWAQRRPDHAAASRQHSQQQPRSRFRPTAGSALTLARDDCALAEQLRPQHARRQCCRRGWMLALVHRADYGWQDHLCVRLLRVWQQNWSCHRPAGQSERQMNSSMRGWPEQQHISSAYCVRPSSACHHAAHMLTAASST